MVINITKSVLACVGNENLVFQFSFWREVYKKSSTLIARELSGFTCNRSLTMNS